MFRAHVPGLVLHCGWVVRSLLSSHLVGPPIHEHEEDSSSDVLGCMQETLSFVSTSRDDVSSELHWIPLSRMLLGGWGVEVFIFSSKPKNQGSAWENSLVIVGQAETFSLSTGLDFQSQAQLPVCPQTLTFPVTPKFQINVLQHKRVSRHPKMREQLFRLCGCLDSQCLKCVD